MSSHVPVGELNMLVCVMLTKMHSINLKKKFEKQTSASIKNANHCWGHYTTILKHWTDYRPLSVINYLQVNNENNMTRKENKTSKREKNMNGCIMWCQSEFDK